MTYRNSLVAPVERPFHYHTMTQLSRQQAADAALLALDAIQRLSPEEQMLGVATLFAALCGRVGVDAHDMHTMGQRVLQREPNHRRTNDALQSLQDYAALRIKGEAEVVIS